MLFKTGWFHEGKISRCLYMQESGILTAAALKNGKIICSCNTTMKGMKYDDIEEKVKIPKKLGYIKLHCCFHYFRTGDIEKNDLVEVRSGKFEGMFGEIIGVERTQYGPRYHVKFPGGCTCPFSTYDLKLIESGENRKFLLDK